MSLAAELRLAGHQVLGPSSDATEAICLAGEQHADIALIDAALSGTVNAIELARTLQGQCEVPVLFLTTEPSLTHENGGAALGMISLPFDPSEIPLSIRAAEVVLKGGDPYPPSVPLSLQLFQ
jgi:DNA-binding response OmpR family regulator